MAEPCKPVFPGERIGTGDPRYPTMVRGFNLRWVGSPEYVQLCGDAAQVLEAVRQAYQEGKRITVRSGGHCYEDFVCDNQDGVIVDLSPMHEVYEDGTGVYCIEGGATLWNVYNALYREYDVTLPGGSCYSVGAGGHLTGAGYGLLSRLYGVTADHLEAVELVRVNAGGEAELIKVSCDSNDTAEQDIFWAHTGGGGSNFGIVTRFWFRAVPAPKVAWLSTLAWNWKDLRSEDQFADLIRRYGEWHVHNSAPESESASLFALLALKQNAAADSQIVLTTQVVDDSRKLLEEFEAAMGANMPEPTLQLAPAGHFGIASPSGEARCLPWLFATQALNGVGKNEFGKYKSAYMKQAFPQKQIEAMWKHLHDHPNPTAVEALLQVDSYGCQINKVAPDATAVAQRSSVMKLQYQTYWTQPEHQEENLSWIRGFYEDMYGPGGPRPDETMDGCFVNYPDVDLQDWQHLYYKDNYPRLQKAKKLCDPHDVFHHKQSIELPR